MAHIEITRGYTSARTGHHYLISAPDSWLYVSGYYLTHYNSYTRCPVNGLSTNKGIIIYSSKSRPLVSGMLANQLLVRLDSTDSCRLSIVTNALHNSSGTGSLQLAVANLYRSCNTWSVSRIEWCLVSSKNPIFCI